MKRITWLLIIAGILDFVAWQDLYGRGGGGGARAGGGGGGARPSMGGGGGGMSRPSPAIGHSPSLGGGGGARPNPGIANRPATGGAGIGRPGPGPGSADSRPGGAGAGIAGGGRPNAGQLNNFLDVPRASTGAIGGATARPGAGGAAADFFRDGGGAASAAQRPAVADRPGIANRPGVENRSGAGQLPAAGTRPGQDNRQQRRQDFADNRPSRVENRQQWQDDRMQRRDEVRNQIQENHPRLDFWSDHPNWAAWRINRPYRWATWGALAGWVGYGAGSATSYDYGSDVYYQDDAVYSGGQQVATAEEYAQQADAIAASAPNTKPEDSEWLPLGVFAVTQDGQKSGSDPTLFMQLAVSKEGIISGTLNNDATKETQTLEGMIDKASQRAAWSVKGKPRPIVETGIGNLTQDTGSALVHFADGQTQQILLVRLEEPKQP
ncbi:MAG: hypothetical protein K8U03_14005 [Planctomycetia bacterium]|nr:hypothetical protein [Planctomycetia bacterium]